MKLSKRLDLVASMISPGCRVADIGTDHGYLPVYLAVNHICGSVIAADIGELPLKRGIENARRYEVEEKIDFRLSDGLSGIAENEVDEIVICGMGGDLIAEIIAAAPWCREKRLILQPASSADALRLYLYKNGFEIATERLVLDGGMLYNIIEAKKGSIYEPSPSDAYISPALLRSNDPLLERYLTRLEGILSEAAAGTAVSKKPHDVQRHEYFQKALIGVLDKKAALKVEKRKEL